MKNYIANTENEIMNNLKIRHEVFIDELNYPIEKVFDFNDQIAILFSCDYLDNTIASVRAILKNGICELDLFATKKDYRHMGIASSLITSIIQYLVNNTSIIDIVVESPIELIPFFTLNGFTPSPIPYLHDETIVNKMKRTII